MTKARSNNRVFGGNPLRLTSNKSLICGSENYFVGTKITFPVKLTTEVIKNWATCRLLRSLK